MTPAGIHLRRASPDDLDALFALRNLPAVRHMAGIPLQEPARFQAVWLDPAVTSRVIADGRALVGSISVFERAGVWEMGYMIAPDHWGRGVASAAVKQMTALVEVRPIYAIVSADNRASRRVLEKAGFTMRGHTSSGALRFALD